MSAARRVLELGAELTLPLSAVTEPIGIFANRGMGKSSAARRFVEQLYHARLPPCVLDIKGDWYGIRAAADGRSPACRSSSSAATTPTSPLQPGSGPVIARYIAEHTWGR